MVMSAIAMVTGSAHTHFGHARKPHALFLEGAHQLVNCRGAVMDKPRYAKVCYSWEGSMCDTPDD